MVGSMEKRESFFYGFLKFTSLILFMDLIGPPYIFIVHLNRLGASCILCMYVIPEYRILKEFASVSLEREADFVFEAVEDVENVLSNNAYGLGYSGSGEAFKSVCSFPIVAGGWFCIDSDTI
jgi:hypothetical protein